MWGIPKVGGLHRSGSYRRMTKKKVEAEIGGAGAGGGRRERH